MSIYSASRTFQFPSKRSYVQQETTLYAPTISVFHLIVRNSSTYSFLFEYTRKPNLSFQQAFRITCSNHQFKFPFSPIIIPSAIVLPTFLLTDYYPSNRFRMHYFSILFLLFALRSVPQILAKPFTIIQTDHLHLVHSKHLSPPAINNTRSRHFNPHALEP